MTPRLRSAATLAGLTALLLVAAVWGFFALTATPPERSSGPPCVERSFGAGETLSSDQVGVRVLNATGRSGVAQQVMETLTSRGFASLGVGNAPEGEEIKGIQVWGEEDDPTVALVKQQFRRVSVVTPEESIRSGVVVVIGKGKVRTRKPVTDLELDEARTVCLPAGLS